LEVLFLIRISLVWPGAVKATEIFFVSIPRMAHGIGKT
jgi:hypothetical protein